VSSARMSPLLLPILICLATAHAKTLESNRFTVNGGPTRKFKSFGDGKTKCSLKDEGVCAKVFDNSNYGGDSMCIGNGEEFENLHDSSVKGGFGKKGGDRISSMKITPGCTLQFWEYANRAKGATATTNIPKLKDIEYTDMKNKKQNWNDKISSIKCTCG